MDTSHKLIKKTVSVLLILTCLILCMPVCIVNAAPVDLETASAYMNGDLFSAGSDYSKYQQEADYVALEIEKYSSRIDVSRYNIPVEDCVLLLQTVLYTHPELYFVSPVNVSYTHANGVMKDFVPIYLYSQAEREEKDRDLAEITEKMLYGIDDTYSDCRKALIVHDRLIIGCQYSQEISTDMPSIYTIYGCLVEGTAVCQGYALAYNYLMENLGIKAEFVSSEEMQHAWSVIQLGNQYYHVDTTWDDPTYDKGGQVYHSYFLKSDSAMENDGSLTKHYGWISNHQAPDTTYDHFFWEKINTQILCKNNMYYYISNLSQDPSKGKLICYDGSKKTVLDTITAKWYAGNTGAYYMNNFSYLFSFKDHLYYNTNDRVYRINMDGSGKTIFYERPKDIVQDIYGLHVNRDGYMYLDYGDSPNQTQTRKGTVKIYDADSLFPSFNVTIAGDANGDGKVDITDVTAIQLYAAGALELTPEQYEAADVNGDGKVNIQDATEIQIICASRV